MRRFTALSLLAAFTVTVPGGGAGCGDPRIVYVGSGTGTSLEVPAIWQEHWFEHTQSLILVEADESVALYLDPQVDRARAAWIFPFASRMWQYTTSVYGKMGPGRLYLVVHEGRYPGCHFANHFAATHDGRNVIDCGFQDLTNTSLDAFYTSHQAAELVEWTSNGKNGSPARPLWMDGKWAEFYQWDLYNALDDTAEVENLFAMWTADSWTDGPALVPRLVPSAVARSRSGADGPVLRFGGPKFPQRRGQLHPRHELG
jgi:hypothetical protein